VGLSTERVGLTLAASRQIDIQRVIELAQLAEAGGYESIWVPETWGTDAVTLLALLARETRRIHLAAGVFNVYSRSAMLIAQTAATLQSLSGGRFLLGLGASGPIVVESWHGVPYRRPVGRTADYVNAIRLALAGATVDFDSTDFTLKGFKLQNPPRLPVPIYIAALGPKNVRMAGAIADGWLPIFVARGHLKSMFDELASGAASTARDVARIDVASYVPAAVGPRAELLIRQQLAYYVGGMGTFYAETMERAGFGGEVKRVREAWQRGDRTTAVNAISASLLEACAASGSAVDMRDRLKAFRAEGVALPILMLPHGTSSDEAAALVEALAPNRQRPVPPPQ
jgi:F420-dependent oxidoreductase-like protein